MIQRDNIKQLSIAAFRALGNDDTNTNDIAIMAAERTIQHLEIEADDVAIEGLQRTYCNLPKGKLKYGTISHMIEDAAADMHVDTRRLYRKLARCRYIYSKYYERLLTK